MIAIDANILLYAFAERAPEHEAAQHFLISLVQREDVMISEFTLTEFYLLLRNPSILQKPLTARKAVEVIQSYRSHPNWRITSFPPEGRQLHEKLWQLAERSQYPRRRLYDHRTALSLLAFGAKEFARANVKDFEDLGFQRVWNPLTTPKTLA